MLKRAQGAYAEYIVSPESMVLHKPKEVGWVAAAGLPENWMTGAQWSRQGWKEAMAG